MDMTNNMIAQEDCLAGMGASDWTGAGGKGESRHHIASIFI